MLAHYPYTGADGIRRLYAVATLESRSAGEGVHVFVAVPASAVFGSAHRMFLLNVALLAALGAAFARFVSERSIVRPVERITATSRRVVEGDLGARRLETRSQRDRPPCPCV